jgi:hypothetical protein
MTDIKKRIKQAEKETNTNPTEKQIEAENYKKGKVNINGYRIAIEQPKGSVRSGVDKNGKSWSITMNNIYGYFITTTNGLNPGKGQDGDQIDVFLGEKYNSKKIFAIDQFLNGKFDETKIFLLVDSKEEAESEYLKNYEKGWKGLKYITEVDEETFKEWLYDKKHQMKPFAQYVDIKKEKIDENIPSYISPLNNAQIQLLENNCSYEDLLDEAGHYNQNLKIITDKLLIELEKCIQSLVVKNMKNDVFSIKFNTEYTDTISLKINLEYTTALNFQQYHNLIRYLDTQYNEYNLSYISNNKNMLDNNKLPNVYFFVKMPVILFDNQKPYYNVDRFRSALEHEVTHMVDDWNYQKRGANNTLCNNKRRVNGGVMTLQSNQQLKDLLFVSYFFDKPEENAFIQMSYEEFKKVGLNSINFRNKYKETKPYIEYNNIINKIIPNIENTNSEKLYKIIYDSGNVLNYKNIPHYNPNKDKSYDDYKNRLINYIEYKAKEFLKKYGGIMMHYLNSTANNGVMEDIGYDDLMTLNEMSKVIKPKKIIIKEEQLPIIKKITKEKNSIRIKNCGVWIENFFEKIKKYKNDFEILYDCDYEKYGVSSKQYPGIGEFKYVMIYTDVSDENKKKYKYMECDGEYEVTCRGIKTKETLENIFKKLGEIGNCGHSFSFKIKDVKTKKEDKLGFDGDGHDHIEILNNKEKIDENKKRKRIIINENQLDIIKKVMKESLGVSDEVSNVTNIIINKLFTSGKKQEHDRFIVIEEMIENVGFIGKLWVNCILHKNKTDDIGESYVNNVTHPTVIDGKLYNNNPDVGKYNYISMRLESYNDINSLKTILVHEVKHIYDIYKQNNKKVSKLALNTYNNRDFMNPAVQKVSDVLYFTNKEGGELEAYTHQSYQELLNGVNWKDTSLYQIYEFLVDAKNKIENNPDFDWESVMWTIYENVVNGKTPNMEYVKKDVFNKLNNGIKKYLNNLGRIRTKYNETQKTNEDLEYHHVTDASPESDEYKMGDIISERFLGNAEEEFQNLKRSVRKKVVYKQILDKNHPYHLLIDFSKTKQGLSIYFKIENLALKIRVSDHFVKNMGRLCNEIHFNLYENNLPEKIARIINKRVSESFKMRENIQNTIKDDKSQLIVESLYEKVRPTLTEQQYKILINEEFIFMDEVGININDYLKETKNKIMNENLELEVDADQINLKSFEKKEELNPKLFQDDILNKRARFRLLEIADNFVDSLDVPWVKPKDIVLVGSIVGYHWSKYSDIDLHIIYDFDEVLDKTEFVKNYYDTKKNEWNDKYGELKIYDYPVEVYVENLKEPATSNGRYSLETDEWLEFPSKESNLEFDKEYVKEKAAKIMTIIDDLQDEFEKNVNNEEILIKLVEQVNKLWTKIKGMRKLGINREGESAWENVVFKIIRRSQHLEKLYNLKTTLFCYSKTLK